MAVHARHPGKRYSKARHPGELLGKYVLPALQLSVSQAARDLAITRQTLHRILAGDAAISPKMAIRLERLCGVSTRFWLIRQREYEFPRVTARIASKLTRIPSRPLPRNILDQIEAANG
jgi:addiction module HigA family antidote